jgi:hypothetical protein
MRRYLAGGDAEIPAGRAVRGAILGAAALLVLGAAIGPTGQGEAGFPLLAVLAFIGVVTALHVIVAGSHLRARAPTGCVVCGQVLLVGLGLVVGVVAVALGGWIIATLTELAPRTARASMAPATVAALVSAYLLSALATPALRRLLRIA